jgi:hypothetical protein
MNTESIVQSTDNYYFMPSQLEAIEAIENLKLLMGDKPLNESILIENEELPSCNAINTLNILKEIRHIGSPNYFVGAIGSHNGQDFFNYMERNNQLAEEELQKLTQEDGFLEDCLLELESYSKAILSPQETEIPFQLSVDTTIIDQDTNCPNPYLWAWGPLKALIISPQADTSNLNSLIELLNSKGLYPGFMLMMPYQTSPLTDWTSYFGNELWYTYQTDPLPLSWQERKTILQLIKY